MPEKIVQDVPPLVHEATNLLVSAVAIIENELYECIGRSRLPQHDPGYVSPVAVDLVHVLTLNVVSFLTGFYRIVLIAHSNGRPEIEAVLADMESLTQRFRSELSDPERRTHVGYLWNYLVVGLHHLLFNHLGRPLFQGRVPTVEEIENGERVNLIFDRVMRTVPPNSTIH